MALFRGNGMVKDRRGIVIVNFEALKDKIFETHNDVLIQRLTSLGFKRVDESVISITDTIPAETSTSTIPIVNEKPQKKSKKKRGKK